MSAIFENRFESRGFFVICLTDSLKYFSKGQSYRSIDCSRYNYHNDKRLENGYLIEDDRGIILAFSRKHFKKT